MAKTKPGYMTTFKERVSYWTYFVGQNVYYNITAAFISTYLAMQGISLGKVATVLLIVKIWDAINDPIFGYIFDKVKFKSGQKSLPWLRIAVLLIPVVTIFLFSIPSGMSELGKLIWFAVASVKGNISREEAEEFEKIADDITNRDLPRRLSMLPIGGNDLSALGYRGKEIGDCLGKILDLVMRGELENTADCILAYLKSEKE